MFKLMVRMSVFMVALMLPSVGFSGVPIPYEEAVEALAIDVRIANDSTGYVSGRQCDECETHRFKITPETKFIGNAQVVGIRELRARNGKPATIIYNLKTRLAAKIVW